MTNPIDTAAGPLRLTSDRPANRPWYADGIRFECQHSSKCCINHGDYAYVYLSRADEERMARHLGLGLRAFRKAHTEMLEGRRILRMTESACIFLDGQACAVYAARPVQCATWPFWRVNLDERVWRTEVSPFCPGIGKGRLYTRDEIDAIAAEVDPDSD